MILDRLKIWNKWKKAKDAFEVEEGYIVKATTLIDYIKSDNFKDFQYEVLRSEDFPYKDELFGEHDKFDDISQLEDVFLIQKEFYELTGIYLVFPLAARFAWEQATRADCVWCSFTYDGFDKYLAELINKYEEGQRLDT